MDQIFFPFTEYWSFYLIFTGFILVLLALDLGVFHRHAHKVSFKEAAMWSAVWVTLAMIFNYAFYRYCLWRFETDPALAAYNAQQMASQLGLEFLSGFLVEKSLSVDNLFVFVAVFSFFGIPEKYQHRVLFYGIIGALIFRAIFVALGSVLMEYHIVVLIFGVLLIVTGIKMFFAPQQAVDPSNNILIKVAKKYLPFTNTIESQKLFVIKNNKLYGTPLLLALIFIEFSDILFAVDSVPAIFALTKEPFIVFTSNVFAILGLRALFFMLAGLYEKFTYLKYGLGMVLIFVGLKMVWLNDLYGGKFPIGLSLGIIFGLISMSILASFVIESKKKPKS